MCDSSAKSLSLLSLLMACQVGFCASSDYPIQPVPFTEVRFTGGFWQQRQATNASVTLPFALDQCESSKRLLNFDLAAETMRRRAAGQTNFQFKPPTIYPFDDSDVFKVLEGGAFCLASGADPINAARMEGMIRRIAAAQEPDGYLYTFRTMHPDRPAHDWIHPQRWLKDPELSHELYNLGHLYEAGVAHVQATGSKSLLDVCLRSAGLLQQEFADGQPRIAPGHEVIEMGLAKLYRQTGDVRWIDLARFFIEARGYGKRAYSQDHVPVTNQTEAVGHAVRANYLYSGMADVTALTGDARYLPALKSIWENVVGRKLHLTGGCGALASGEAYGKDYELPNNAYNETCAAIAFLFWNHRMFLLTGEAKYMDAFERTLYNGFLSGVSLSGDRFFYPNTLEYDGQARNNHGFAGRAPWFGCACCPPNILRMLASLGGYAFAVRDANLYLNLYAQGEATAHVAGTPVRLEASTAYPWDGRVRVLVTPENPARFTLLLRIPGWVRGQPVPSDLYQYQETAPAPWTVAVNGETLRAEATEGFLRIEREWKPGDRVELDFPMPVRRVLGNEKIAATRGLVALERGPIVYCFEGIDNDQQVFDLCLPVSAIVKPESKALLNGVTVLDIEGGVRLRTREDGTSDNTSVRLTAIPYHAWNNRGLSPMAVWLPSDPANVKPHPKPAPK